MVVIVLVLIPLPLTFISLSTDIALATVLTGVLPSYLDVIVLRLTPILSLLVTVIPPVIFTPLLPPVIPPNSLNPEPDSDDSYYCFYYVSSSPIYIAFPPLTASLDVISPTINTPFLLLEIILPVIDTPFPVDSILPLIITPDPVDSILFEDCISMASVPLSMISASILIVVSESDYIKGVST